MDNTDEYIFFKSNKKILICLYCFAKEIMKIRNEGVTGFYLF